ncbi:L,D-transpeptidase family protein [Azospirillum sp. SYSU D00513]|uniref:L,D-transpeptidase family protein n=1 Tax=Azospirillum sp. SYSU D00513 TaxID=2812561 RepID=UPI001FFE2DBF|nr:L,D-transpeptidase family protein [Azospirillum sp. SYSU D00513]
MSMHATKAPSASNPLTSLLLAVRLFAMLAVCGLIAGTGHDAAAQTAATAGYRDTLTAWADQLDAAAGALDAMPAQAVTRVGPGPLLRPGMTGERVARLSQRMIELGFLTEAQRTDLFDPALENAVRSFQLSQGLRDDGLVGSGTRIALDRAPREAAVIMRRSAASMRQFRDTAPDTIVLVNLPSQTTTLVQGGHETLTMRAIVGRPSRETPLLHDRITHIIVNPTWTVPPTVMKEDKLPLLRAKGSPGIAQAVVYLDGEAVAPETIDWTYVSPGRVRIVQQPGDHNALGRFRFNLTNSDSIYLHGTNEPRLFDRDIRTVSSGCVRLEDARRMAEVLLAGSGVSPERIDQMLAKSEPQWVKLSKPVPVQFVYWTATVDNGGTIRLHPDIYDLIDERAEPPAPEASRA